jgi:two-component system LytT family sensor kinase
MIFKRYCHQMDAVSGSVLGVTLVASGFAAVRFIRPRRVLSPEGSAMQAALHAASATLPHLRRGLTRQSAAKAIPHLLILTQASAVAIADHETVLAYAGVGQDHHRGGEPAERLLGESASSRRTRVQMVECPDGDCPLGARVVAPLVVREVHIGSLAAFFHEKRDIRPVNVRIVEEAAALVAAQVELATLTSQGERLAKAELSALRAQISPHFVYNALAAVANTIHTCPEEARELLIDFAEFTRYAFKTESPYVTLREELAYADRYLRLERARFRDRLDVRIEVAPEALTAVVPVLSLQPLVENAVRHGIERHGGAGELRITGLDLGSDVEVRVADNGTGMTAEDARSALRGTAGGIGLANVQTRLRTTFGPGYGLEIESALGHGTVVRMTVPKFRPGVRAA